MWPSDQKAKDHGGFGRTIGKNSTRIQVHTHSIYIYDIYMIYIYMIYIYIHIHLMLHTYVWHYLTIYCHPSLFRGGGAGLALTPKYFSKKNLVYIYIYSRIRHRRMWSGACKPAEAHISMFFLSPSFAWEIFEGGRCKTMAFYSSRSHPPRNSIAAQGFRPFLRIFKDQR